jgi:enoyl-CoA hydratase/carnithine racemase
MGLVSMVVPRSSLMERVNKLASHIASSAPVAVRYTKEAVHKGMDLGLEQGLALEADLSFILQSTRDRAEGISSFLDKRHPKFKGE